MNHKDRFLATIERKNVDRPACWFGIPFQSALPLLYVHYHANSPRDLKLKIGDDLWEVDVPYHNPPTNHVACAFEFAKKGAMTYENRTLTSPGVFEDCTSVAQVDDFPWPDPAEHMNPAECRQLVDSVPKDYPVLGVLWSAHFQDVLAAFGMTNAFIKMHKAPAIFNAVHEKIVDFYLRVNEIFYKATQGRLDAILIGNDYGGQNKLLLSPKQIKTFSFPGAKKIINQAKRHGVKVIYHSCGSVHDIIPDLIELGVDAIHPIQALAAQMEPELLKQEFGTRVSFCGGVDAQNLLHRGTPVDVRKRVRELMALFPTGLIISPSHEAVVPEIPPANIATLIDTVKGDSKQ